MRVFALFNPITMTDRWTNGRTKPLIESRVRNLKEKKLISLDSIEERKGADVEEKQSSMSFFGNETFRFGSVNIYGGIGFVAKQRR